MRLLMTQSEVMMTLPKLYSPKNRIRSEKGSAVTSEVDPFERTHLEEDTKPHGIERFLKRRVEGELI